MEDRFVGRGTELDVLTSEFERARATEARVALVEAPPGIGKSALVRRFLAAAPSALVLHADGDGGETQLAFGVLERLLAGIGSPLSRQLGAVVGRQVPVPNPMAVGTEIVGLLGELQHGSPVVLYVDDAQWADAPSLAALTFALRRLRADQVLSVVCVRAGDEGVLPEGLRRLVDGQGGIRLRLEGLDVSTLQALAAAVTGETLSARAARRLWEHTGGSPLHVLALLREVGLAGLDRVDALPAPSSYAILALGRLAGCAPPTERLVVAAAVLGHRCSLATAPRLADSPGDPLEALGEAVAAGLLQVDSGDHAGTRLSFPHPLVRAAVYGDLGPARRAALHRRAAEVLQGDAALAHRLAAAGPEDPELAEELLTVAAASTARGAWGEAAAHLLSAARLDPPEHQHRVLEAAKLMLVGLDVVGVAAWRDEIAAYPPSADRGYVLGYLEVLMGHATAARVLLEEAFSLCDRERRPDLATMIASQLGFLAINDGRGADGIQWARAALEWVAPLSPPAGLARSLLRTGLVIAGRPREALALVTPDDDPAPALGPLAVDEVVWRGQVRLWTDDLPAARHDLAQVLGVVRSGNLTPSTSQGLVYLAETEFRLGAWDDALVRVGLAVSLATDTGAAYALPFAHPMLASVHGLRGRWDLADGHAAAARASAHGLGQPAAIAYACPATAHVALARGDPAAVIEAVTPSWRWVRPMVSTNRVWFPGRTSTSRRSSGLVVSMRPSAHSGGSRPGPSSGSCPPGSRRQPACAAAWRPLAVRGGRPTPPSRRASPVPNRWACRSSAAS